VEVILAWPWHELVSLLLEVVDREFGRHCRFGSLSASLSGRLVGAWPW
jgi:hypothetical protein